MSRNIDPTFQSAYDSEVKRSYGQKSVLKGTVKTKMNVEGKSVYFRKKGKGMEKRRDGVFGGFCVRGFPKTENFATMVAGQGQKTEGH